MISKLNIYDNDGNAISRHQIRLSDQGIEESRRFHPWKQVLLLPQTIIDTFDLEPSDLKENILLDVDFDLHALTSGTVIQLGSTQIRLTLHCEPCSKIKHLIAPGRLEHQRGYLGQVIKGGEITLKDEIAILDQRYEPIPYGRADRIKWYLDQQSGAVSAATLVESIGLSKSYCRALPRLLKTRPDIDANKIVFAAARR